MDEVAFFYTFAERVTLTTHNGVTYTVDKSRALDIAEIGSTRRFCENHVTENAYYDMLEGVTHYEMDGDNMLLLNNGMLVGIMHAMESK